MLYIYVGLISLLLCLICIIKSWFAWVLIIYFYIISWIRCYSLCVIFYFLEIMWERWVYRNLWKNGGQRTMLKCLRRCSWSAWIVYHDWKLQIRKEIKEAKSEKEKYDLSTDQYFGRISLLKNPIDTRLDGLEPWLKYLQLSSFEFSEILNFRRPKLTHKLLL